MEAPHQAQFRPIVQQRLAEIETELNAGADSTAPISPDVSVGRLSRLDSMQMQQMALAGKRRLEEQRPRLYDALRRIDAGTYGRCEHCGGDVAIERLQLQPDAVMCMPCLQALAPKKTRRVG